MYVVYDYNSRDQFDRCDSNADPFTGSRVLVEAQAKRLQRNGYWVRVYRDGEYQYYLTPLGESREP